MSLLGPETLSALVAFLLVWTANVTLLVAVSAAFTAVLRRASAAVRHAAWASAAVVALLVPALQLLAPPLLPFPSPGAFVTARVHPLDAPTAPYGSPSPAAATAPTVVATDAAPSATSPATSSAPAPGTPPEDAASMRAPRSATVWAWVPLALVVLWLLGATVQMVRFVTTRLGVRRALHGGGEVRRLERCVEDLGRTLGMRSPVPVVESTLPVPFTAGIVRPLIGLPKSWREWPDEVVRRVLLHEMAHVQRRDVAARWIVDTLLVFQWFNPLAWLVRTRVRAEQEFACDDVVVLLASRPGAYADDLLSFGIRVEPTRTRAFGMATLLKDGTSLSSRIERVLDGRVSRRQVSPLAHGVGIAALACVALPLASSEAPGPSVGPDHGSVGQEETTPAAARPDVDRARTGVGGRPSDPNSTPLPVRAGLQGPPACRASRGRAMDRVRTETGMEVEWSDDDCRVSARLEQPVTLGFDPSSVLAVGEGGVFELVERRGDARRRYRATRDTDGRVRHEYWVNGVQQPFDGAAQPWLDDALAELRQQSGLGADGRVGWLLDRGGVPAVTAEIRRIQRPFVAQEYYHALFRHAQLTGPDAERVFDDALRLARRGRDELAMANLLSRVADAPSLGQDLALRIIDEGLALRDVLYRRQVLAAVLRGQPPTVDTVARELLAATLRFDDILYRHGFLMALVQHYGNALTAEPGWERALRSLESDPIYTRRLLFEVVDQAQGGGSGPTAVLPLLRDLRDRAERPKLLRHIVDRFGLLPTYEGPYRTALAALDGDYDRRRFLVGVATDTSLADAGAALVVRLSRVIGDEYDRARVLLKVIETHRLSPEVRLQLDSAVNVFQDPRYRAELRDALDHADG